MRRIFYSILAIFMAISASAKDVEVIMTMQITRSQSNLIPEKTDELKLQNYQIVAQGDMQNLFVFLDQVSKEEYEHYVFKLLVYSDEGILHFEVKGFDPMNEPKESRELMLGNIKIGRSYFIVDKISKNSNYKKIKGKTNFIREFEMVAAPRVNDETHIIGTINDGKINFSKYVMDGENKLQTPEKAEPERLDYNQGAQQEQIKSEAE